MATAQKATKPSFINRNKVVAGLTEIKDVRKSLLDAAQVANETAMEALTTNDRQGVLLAMKVGGIYTRSANALEKAITRSQRVRLSKDERKQYETDQTLPEGVELVTIEEDEDDDNDND
jgi:hypothetical protein